MARLQPVARVGRCIVIFVSIVAVASPLPWVMAQAPSPDAGNVLGHLNLAISWYRHLASLDITAGQPSDLLYLESARNSAAEALQLAFQSAAAEAALLSAGKNGAASAEDQPAQQQQSFAKSLNDTNARIQQLQSQLNEVQTRLANANAKNRQQLQAQRDALQGQLELQKMIQDALQKIVATSSSTVNEGAGSTLATQVNQLKQSVPEVFAATKKEGASSGGTSKATSAQNSGLFGQFSILLGQMRAIHDIDQVIAENQRVRSSAEALQAPLRSAMKGVIQQGRAIVNQAPSATGDEAGTRKQFASLVAQFKQLSEAAVPMRQEMILLDDCKGDLVQWRNSITTEYGRVLRSLLMRVFGVLIALGFVFLLSQIWKRTTLRYVRDARRRRQLFLVRRFVIAFLMTLVIVAGFISEFSSLATFAGFLTAGIAVALQTVILSIAAYFFLIGRYGVRVGDRVTIANVTGDVIEVGLIRLYLMELSGTGIDLYPTGRVVVFSNSVMFQAAPFFKQLPGTAYAWHELAVTLAPDADLPRVERALMEAVTSIYSQYGDAIQRQHALVERILDTTIAAPVPVGKVQFSATGPEFVVRYPVEIQRAADIDDELTRKLMEIINGDPQLKAAVSASPKLRAAIKA